MRVEILPTPEALGMTVAKEAGLKLNQAIEKRIGRAFGINRRLSI